MPGKTRISATTHQSRIFKIRKKFKQFYPSSRDIDPEVEEKIIQEEVMRLVRKKKWL